ncbi:hypothetical protein ZOSMA_4023G00010, partial [Zostera marina]
LHEPISSLPKHISEPQTNKRWKEKNEKLCVLSLHTSMPNPMVAIPYQTMPQEICRRPEGLPTDVTSLGTIPRNQRKTGMVALIAVVSYGSASSYSFSYLF